MAVSYIPESVANVTIPWGPDGIVYGGGATSVNAQGEPVGRVNAWRIGKTCFLSAVVMTHNGTGSAYPLFVLNNSYKPAGNATYDAAADYNGDVCDVSVTGNAVYIQQTHGTTLKDYTYVRFFIAWQIA